MNIRRAFLWGLFALTASGAMADIRRLPLGPVAPKSYAECDQYAGRWAEISRQHTQCLASSACKGPNKARSSGSCSCAACQHLHLERQHHAQRDAQLKYCRSEVSQYLANRKASEQLARATQVTPLPPKPSVVPPLVSRPQIGRPVASSPVLPPLVPPPGPDVISVQTPAELTEELGRELANLSALGIELGNAAKPPSNGAIAGTAPPLTLSAYNDPAQPALLPGFLTSQQIMDALSAAAAVYSQNRLVPGDATVKSDAVSTARVHREALIARGHTVDVIRFRGEDSFMIAQRFRGGIHETIIGVEGTENRTAGVAAEDWSTNLTVDPVFISPATGQRISACLPGSCIRVHKGFYEMAQAIYESPEYQQQIRLAERDPRHRLVFTGHSQGAGTASILSGMTVARHPQLRPRVSAVTAATPGYTSGASGVEWFNRQVPQTVHFVDSKDPIRVTTWALNHGGQVVQINTPEERFGVFEPHSVESYLRSLHDYFRHLANQSPPTPLSSAP